MPAAVPIVQVEDIALANIDEKTYVLTATEARAHGQPDSSTASMIETLQFFDLHLHMLATAALTIPVAAC